MATVKIASNPYKRELTFFVFDKANSCWIPINERSKLRSDDIYRGFLPFKAMQIVDIICKEFGSSEPVKIVFEGCDDEYLELEQICDFEQYRSQVQLERSTVWIENARDILPQVVDVFKTLRPFFEQNVSDRGKISDDLRKFSEASDDAIPICVLGNYSAGKSTFINALIGQELLPSGDAPITARVFQIQASKQPDRASIAFSLAGQRITFRFDAAGMRRPSMWQNLPLIKKLSEELLAADLGLIGSMNRALEIINSSERYGFEETVSDLVEIEVPFRGEGAMAKLGEFVIFDTPGSNSATNANHQRILQDAMEGFSNGLPVYVCEYTSLDSTDNQKLYNDIKQIDALDERFTIIVVNKADAASLPREGFSSQEVAQILSESIPRNMYSQGIYFVSSIMGLGAKSSGELTDEFYAEKYEEQERKYTDPSARFYKQLYIYDIMPEQIKERVVERSAHATNVMLANSGLLSVEDAMGVFAVKYSSYNKCFQSEALLSKLIDITSDEVEGVRKKRELDREHREESLERDKRELVDNLEDLVEHRRADAIEGYRPELNDFVATVCPVEDAERLDNRQDELVQMHRKAQGLNDAQRVEKEKAGDITKNLANRAQSLFSEFSFDKVPDLFTGLGNDISTAVGAHAEVDSVLRKCDRSAARDLFKEIKTAFVEKGQETLVDIEQRSRDYWISVTKSVRAALYRFVTESDQLDDGKREDLAATVSGYKALSIKNIVDSVFDEQRLRGYWIWDFRLMDSDKLNVEAAANQFNREMKEFLTRAFEEIAAKHSNEFDRWLSSLRDELVDNIIEYNPALRNQDEIIRSDTEKIQELEAGMRMLSRYEEQVKQMMSWKREGADYGDR